MPLHGTHNQRDASYFFNINYIKNRRNIIIPENILELEKRIIKKKKSLNFLDELYNVEKYNSTINQFNEDILEKIDLYENPNNEKFLFEKSDYYIIYLDGYYIKTKEGNYRNWIYSIEIGKEYEQLEKYIIILEEELRQKIINIGIEIALLFIF